MKKSVIALAVASAMPFAVQADTTLSGNVKAKYIISTGDANLVDKGLDVDSDFDVASTEVLANGMTASASFDVSSQAAGGNGKASLAGGFGTVTVGSALDADGAFQAGDIAGVVGDTTTGDSDESASEANAIHYSGSFSGLNLAVQLNAATTAKFEATDDNDLTPAKNVTANAQTSSNQVGVSYEVIDGLSVGYSSASAALGDASGTKPDSGVMAKTSAFGVSYVTPIDGLTVKAGKQKDNGARGSVAYAMDNWSVTYNHDGRTGKEADIDFTLDMNNGLSFVMEYDRNKKDSTTAQEIDFEATYVTGDLTIKASYEHDKSKDMSVAYGMGNADITLARDGSKKETSLAYNVSF